ncbi:uncharacterized protein YcbK (DUF882 family) [Rhizobium sp. PP-F2F-G38]|uniref:Murein endopeptidase K n=1 Tax=Ferranicluibacter rubi TaxID=2715133 RepID=A0AA44CBL6_9HYPH|nr:DUF882 domain-containing protein [Ferranicluibacter rubi]PYE34243.1 uncharacterized protein YcbK (DUF882 family) [Rhizobium sp. PP-WC-1G-195]PYE96879.1 uncharacterized protein YcbK (DUF882 family) [Rhizobium sp. PP-F2F-G38]TCP86293.1 uncharacterized protein YcbK (DUF882 family) [Rhizobium sp. PP-CC-2G-626]TCQ23438.1 uncharacterized protein YcbK (DUF882 family) [Rhizobium sp. PP-CC-3G-465]
MFERSVAARLAGLLPPGAHRALQVLARCAARASAIAAIAVSALTLGAFEAVAEDRALKLFFTHTGERATITFKRNGQYDAKGLAQINRLLRDWRRNEPARMDPRLLDLVWDVYERSGAKSHINIVSAYRSPATNSMLRGRSRSTGVAKNSQHTLGKAMDFFIPGVSLAKLRSIAMQLQAGGVGYYPTSGSPFVHLDVGNVRAWPRMSRQELVRIFPNGKTLHLPSDGRALPGYDSAMADHKRRASGKSIIMAGSAAPHRSPETTKNDASLVTALLPTQTSRAQKALDLQTRPIPETRPETSPDLAAQKLAALSVPVPTFRAAVLPPAADITESDHNALREGTSTFLPSPRFTARAGLALAGRALRQPTPAETTLAWGRGSLQPAWTVTDRALLGWALARTDTLQRLVLPRNLRRVFAATATSASARPDEIPGRRRGASVPSIPFDANRFARDG